MSTKNGQSRLDRLRKIKTWLEFRNDAALTHQRLRLAAAMLSYRKAARTPQLATRYEGLGRGDWQFCVGVLNDVEVEQWRELA